jgi:hypothetical protein
VNRAGACSDKKPLPLDRGVPAKILLLIDGAELVGDWWERYWEFLGDPVRMVGYLRGEKGESLARDGRVRPRKDLAEARVVVGDRGVGARA